MRARDGWAGEGVMHGKLSAPYPVQYVLNKLLWVSSFILVEEEKGIVK